MRRNYVSGWDISLPSRRRQKGKKAPAAATFSNSKFFNHHRAGSPFSTLAFHTALVSLCYCAVRAGGVQRREIYTERARSRWYLWWWLVCRLFANFILRHDAAPRMCIAESRDTRVYATGAAWKEKSRAPPFYHLLFLFFSPLGLALCGVFPECSRIIRMKWENAAVDEIPASVV